MTASLLGAGAPSPAATPEPLSALAEANTAFALDLYQREKDLNPNLFFSPYSLSTALAMTYAGARGETERQMAKVLHFNLTQPELARAFGDLAERFDRIQQQKQVRLNTANSLWCEQTYSFLESFLDVGRRQYRAEVRAMDFLHQSEAAREEINRWVEQKTEDKIRNLLQPGQVGSSTRLVLCNAIYFKGTWASRFDPRATADLPFYVTSDRRVDTPLMTRMMNVRTRAFGDFSLFTLPYAGHELSLVVLLPAATNGLPDCERQLSAGALRQWLADLDRAREMEARVFLPKFKLTCRLDLARELAAMGMPSAFGGHADFSGMSAARDLFLSDVVHQAFVDVNEEGTEAAAATAVGVRATAIEMPIILRVDHPFLFLIRENQTGTILFLGRVTDPTK